MFEHVGFRDYRRLCEVSRRCLDDAGLSLLHCIGSNKSVTHTDPWIAKYIFPNSMLHSAAQIATGTEALFVTAVWTNFGTAYDRTLQAWQANTEAHCEQLPEHSERPLRPICRYHLYDTITSSHHHP